MEKMDLEAQVQDEKEISMKEVSNDTKYPMYNKYDIIINILNGNDFKQLKLEVYLTKEEAYRASINLNDKIQRLVSTNSPVSLSIVCRNKDNEIVKYGLIDIVGITHNIPDMELVDE